MASSRFASPPYSTKVMAVGVGALLAATAVLVARFGTPTEAPAQVKTREGETIVPGKGVVSDKTGRPVDSKLRQQHT